jgi:hypothetical protein
MTIRHRIRLAARASLLAAIAVLASCAAEDLALDEEAELEEAAAASQVIRVPAGTKFVIPKGLTAVLNGYVLVSTVNDDPSTGGEQGKSCPFQGAKKTQSGDTACGYDNNRVWVCCDASCDYTCNINQHTNQQYWNTDSCSVVESSCAPRAGGPGGGGFDILQTQPAG